jgi:hypothetical protein
MLWFASDTNTPVFWLVRKGSNDFNKLKEVIDFKKVDKGIKTFGRYDAEFEDIVQVVNEL